MDAGSTHVYGGAGCTCRVYVYELFGLCCQGQDRNALLLFGTVGGASPLVVPSSGPQCGTHCVCAVGLRAPAATGRQRDRLQQLWLINGTPVRSAVPHPCSPCAVQQRSCPLCRTVPLCGTGNLGCTLHHQPCLHVYTPYTVWRCNGRSANHPPHAPIARRRAHIGTVLYFTQLHVYSTWHNNALRYTIRPKLQSPADAAVAGGQTRPHHQRQQQHQ